MIVEWLSTSDPRWEALLDQIPHDIYHLPQYLKVSARYEDAEPVAFLACEGSCFCLIPLLIRRLPDRFAAPSDWRDVKSPYGYAAPLFRGDPCWIGKVIDAFIGECQSRNIVSAFLSMHPVLEGPLTIAGQNPAVKHGETVYVDLSLTEGTLWAQRRERLRSYISKLQRTGFQTQFDDWSAYSDFVSVYRQTMARLNANPFYCFPAEYFCDLRVALGQRLHFCSVVDARGEFASGALLTESQGIVQYHLSGTADRFILNSPSKLMLHEITLWAKREGHRILHLGGGLGARADSLFYFKTGFSPLRSDFMAYHLVCDERKYESLCLKAAAFALTEEYFPKYRRSMINAFGQMTLPSLPERKIHPETEAVRDPGLGDDKVMGRLA